ncbi:MAG: glycoside hydrolase [Steroidobacteraceae bacterium]|nr:glycoside hydrolase [Steroidobacteraceae bacterium]
MSPAHRFSRILSALLVAVLPVACGGGSGGGGNGAGNNPPPSIPPVFSSPTAVRVSQPTPFSNGCLPLQAGTRLYTNAEVEPHLAIDPSNPNHLVAAWQQDRLSDGGARGLVTAVSVDGGASWTGFGVAPFSGCAGGAFARASDPWLSLNGNTAIQVGIAFTGNTGTAGARSAVLASRSVDGGFTWSAAVALADDDGSLYFNDKESVTIDSADPRFVYAVWDRLEGNDRGPAVMVRSTDAGFSWSPPTIIYDPGPGGHQTIGNVIAVAPDGTIFDFFTELGPSPGNPGQTVGRLAVVRSTDKGVTWSAPLPIADLRSVGTTVSSLPRVAVRAGEILGSFAVDPRNGTLYAVWQDSRFSGGAHDSIVMAWSQDGGSTWSAPVPVNSDLDVPAFTPTLSVLPDGTIGVAYYDFRQPGTSTFQPTDLWLATSRDRATWRETRLAGNFDLRIAPDASGLFVGDYQGLTGFGSTFIALYVRTNNGDVTNRTDVFSDRLDTSTLAAARAASLPSARPLRPPAWTASAQARVSRNLSDIRAMRQREWQQWLDTIDPDGSR